jgi:hypothetical protein
VITARLIRTIVIALLGLGVAKAKAAGQSAARLGLAAGVTAPTSGYGSDKNVGYHIGLLVDVRLPESVLGFRIDGAFHEIGYSNSSTREDIWLANANVVLKAPTGRFAPYVIGGGGIYNSHRTPFPGAHSSTDPGVNVGGGIRFNFTDATTFIEARYHKVSGDSRIRILPITVGVLF